MEYDKDRWIYRQNVEEGHQILKGLVWVFLVLVFAYIFFSAVFGLAFACRGIDWMPSWLAWPWYIIKLFY